MLLPPIVTDVDDLIAAGSAGSPSVFAQKILELHALPLFQLSV